MRNKKLIPIIIMVIAIVFQMCDKKEDEKPPYVGEWETEVYEFTFGTEVLEQKMLFSFRESDFEATIQSIINKFPFNFLGVRGNVKDKGDNLLDVSLTEIGEFSIETNDFDWKTKVANLEDFNTLYMTYLSTSLPLEFETKYNVEGNKLELVIAAVNDTINLYKK